MRVQPIGTASEERFVVVCEDGEEPLGSLLRVAVDEKIEAASFTAIGGLSEAVLGFFDIERRDYWKIPVVEQTEVLSLVGNVTTYEGKPRLHAHVVLGKSDGKAIGGHLLAGRVRPTLEVVLVRTPARLARELDPRFGIPLIRLGARRAA